MFTDVFYSIFFTFCLVSIIISVVNHKEIGRDWVLLNLFTFGSLPLLLLFRGVAFWIIDQFETN